MKNKVYFTVLAMLLLMFFLNVMVASAQSLDVSGLVTTLFDATNTWIPSLGPILVIGPAIAIAVLIIGLIVVSIRNGIQSAKSGK